MTVLSYSIAIIVYLIAAGVIYKRLGRHLSPDSLCWFLASVVFGLILAIVTTAISSYDVLLFINPAAVGLGRSLEDRFIMTLLVYAAAGAFPFLVGFMSKLKNMHGNEYYHR